MFLISERYRLELVWDKVKYEREGVCKLFNARFRGPALSIANEIKPNDSINLDFYRQYFILVKNPYVAKLSWGEVVYNSDNTVTLKNAKISHDTELNRVPTFKNTDYVVIDTKDHEEAVHGFNLVYKTYVVSEEGDEYDFRSKK